MKKFLIFIIVFVQTASFCSAAEEIVLDLSNSSEQECVAIEERNNKLFSEIDKQEIIEGSYSKQDEFNSECEKSQ